MSVSKGSRRLTVFWWVLAAMIGAGIGAETATTQGLPGTMAALVGVGLPILAVVGILEWTADDSIRKRPKPWPEARRPINPSQRARSGNKLVPRRTQLHAINGRKAAEPPSSGNA